MHAAIPLPADNDLLSSETLRHARKHERGEGLLSWVVGLALLIMSAGLYFGGLDYAQGKIQSVLVGWAISNTINDVRTSVAGSSGQYSTGNMYTAVRNTKAYPWFATPDDAGQQFNIMLGGTMRVTGAGNTFVITMSGYSQPVCMANVVKAYGQLSVTINSNTFADKASSVQASANCTTGNSNSFGVTAS